MSATENISEAAAPIGAPRRLLDAAVTVMALGTNKLAGRGAGWLARRGLARYVLPALLLNEAFGAYRAYLAGGAMGWW
jgi:hypothetical protein